MEHWDEGVYTIRGKGAADALPLILSAGVHGDETAPVQVLEHLQRQLLQRSLIPRRPLLLIIANQPALLNGKRFMQTNMNRLFGAPVRPAGYETKRSLALEAYCRDFAELYGVGWHLDLHSTIKPSRHEHFALMPACNRHYDDAWAPLLAHHGFTALVRQRSPAFTFSNFTCATLGFESFTLECGAVRGSSASVPLVLQPLLMALLEDDPFVVPSNATLQRYEVTIDLIKRSTAFRFRVNEQSDNFATFVEGTVLAQDGDVVIRAPCDHSALLFANSAVPVGDRAGLVLRPIAADALPPCH